MGRRKANTSIIGVHGRDPTRGTGIHPATDSEASAASYIQDRSSQERSAPGERRTTSRLPPILAYPPGRLQDRVHHQRSSALGYRHHGRKSSRHLRPASAVVRAIAQGALTKGARYKRGFIEPLHARHGAQSLGAPRAPRRRALRGAPIGAAPTAATDEATRLGGRARGLEGIPLERYHRAHEERLAPLGIESPRAASQCRVVVVRSMDSVGLPRWARWEWSPASRRAEKKASRNSS